MDFCGEHGIKRQLSTTRTPQENLTPELPKEYLSSTQAKAGNKSVSI